MVILRRKEGVRKCYCRDHFATYKCIKCTPSARQRYTMRSVNYISTNKKKKREKETEKEKEKLFGEM